MKIGENEISPLSIPGANPVGPVLFFKNGASAAPAASLASGGSPDPAGYAGQRRHLLHGYGSQRKGICRCRHRPAGRTPVGR